MSKHPVGYRAPQRDQPSRGNSKTIRSMRNRTGSSLLWEFPRCPHTAPGRRVVGPSQCRPLALSNPHFPRLTGLKRRRGAQLVVRRSSRTRDRDTRPDSEPCTTATDPRRLAAICSEGRVGNTASRFVPGEPDRRPLAEVSASTTARRADLAESPPDLPRPGSPGRAGGSLGAAPAPPGTWRCAGHGR